jgi:AcrR family transcriptional regulator
VAATLEVVAEKGFVGASLEDIAARAGMTKGSIYSNFRGKADLFMAAMTAKDLGLQTRLPAEAPLRTRLTELGENLVEMIGRAQGEAKFLAEFQLYAFSDPELRRALAELYSQAFAGGAVFLARLPDLKPGLSPRSLAVLLQSLSLGLAVQSFMAPDEVTPETIRAAFAALADGVVRD